MGYPENPDGHPDDWNGPQDKQQAFSGRLFVRRVSDGYLSDKRMFNHISTIGYPIDIGIPLSTLILEITSSLQ